MTRRLGACGSAALCAVACLVLASTCWVPRAEAYNEGFPTMADCDISWYNASGSYFQISTAAQLAGLAWLVTEEHVTFAGQTVVLARDLDLSSVCSGSTSWRPIGNGYEGGTAFSGTFDGQGHTIGNLHIDNSGMYNALFGHIDGADLRNFTVTGDVSGDIYIAGVVAWCSDSDLSNITNECTVDAYRYNRDTKHQGYAAGVVSYSATLRDGASQHFQNLVNKGPVVSNCFYTAGVAGFILNANGTTTLERCANYADIYAYKALYGVDEAGKGVGGVLGATAGNFGSYKLHGCLNTGKVGSANCPTVGGVAGYLGGNNSSIEAAKNSGEVAGEDTAGGVVGYLGSDGGSVSNSLNTGKVSGDVAGGVVGSASRSNQTLSNNFSLEGSVKRAYGAGSGGKNDGAVVGAGDMGKQSFLDQLDAGTGNYTISDATGDGLPTLSWTEPSATPGQGGAADDPADAQDPGYEGGDQTDASQQDGSDSGADGKSLEDYLTAGQVEDPWGSPEIPASSSSDFEDMPSSAEPDPATVDQSLPPADTAELSQAASNAAVAVEPAAEQVAPAQEPEEGASDPSEAAEPVEALPAMSQDAEWVDLGEAPASPDSASEAQAHAVHRTLVEVSAVPEPQLNASDLGDDQRLSQMAYASMGAGSLLCLGAGIVYESLLFTRSRRAARELAPTPAFKPQQLNRKRRRAR